MVERGEGTDDNAEPEVKLSIVEGPARVPATVGAPEDEAESGDEAPEDKILPGEPSASRSEIPEAE